MMKSNKEKILVILISFLLFSLLYVMTVMASYGEDTAILVQESLNNAGYDCGVADGIVGEKTKAAIRQYEEDNNMPVTGEISTELLDMLGIEVTATTTPNASSASGSISMNLFISRYNDYVSYLKQDQGVVINEVTSNTFANNDGVAPNNNLNFCVNPNTNVKDPVGIINIWGDASNLDDSVSLGEVTALFYAFDESLDAPEKALDLFGELTEGDGRISRNGISYDNYTMPGMIGFKGTYDGFEINQMDNDSDNTEIDWRITENIATILHVFPEIDLLDDEQYQLAKQLSITLSEKWSNFSVGQEISSYSVEDRSNGAHNCKIEGTLFGVQGYYEICFYDKSDLGILLDFEKANPLNTEIDVFKNSLSQMINRPISGNTLYGLREDSIYWNFDKTDIEIVKIFYNADELSLSISLRDRL